MSLITQEGQYWEKGNFSTPKLDETGDNFSTPKVDETEGFQCLVHLNWTICISNMDPWTSDVVGEIILTVHWKSVIVTQFN